MTKTLFNASSLLCSTALLATLSHFKANAQPTQPGFSTGAELVQACRQPDDSAAGSFCLGYLLGFLQAHPGVGFDEDLPSDYMQRVMRTRAPVHPETTSLKSASYCLEDSASVDRIRKTIGSMDASWAESRTPAGLIEHLLERDYRCSP